jgi:hypothetical protein
MTLLDMGTGFDALAAKEMTGATDTYAEAALKTLQKSLNDLTMKESQSCPIKLSNGSVY